MTVEERLTAMLTASPETLRLVDAALSGRPPEPEKPVSLKLWKLGEAATAAGVSRCTLWRGMRNGSIKAIEIRPGRYRIPDGELVRFCTEGRK